METTSKQERPSRSNSWKLAREKAYVSLLCFPSSFVFSFIYSVFLFIYVVIFSCKDLRFQGKRGYRQSSSQQRMTS